MKLDKVFVIEWFLRISISVAFLSAVADRFGLWNESVSAWGNWEKFVTYTQSLLPFLPDFIAPAFAVLATFLEVIFAVLLIVKVKSEMVAAGSGLLLLSFALAMTFSSSIKAPLDYSVYTASAAAFGLALLVERRRDTVNAQ